MMNDNINDELNNIISGIPSGYVSKKTINGKQYSYLQWKENGKVKSKYIQPNQVDYVVSLLDEKKRVKKNLLVEVDYSDTAKDTRKRLRSYASHLFLGNHVPIGVQSFETLISERLFYVDKTRFIADWWISNDPVTLITRPRRFGKTLNLSMMNCFFSIRYKDRSDLFDKLEVWKYKEMRDLQGTIPTIFISFGAVKESDAEGQLHALGQQIYDAFFLNRYVKDHLSDEHKAKFDRYLNSFDYTKDMILGGVRDLCSFFYEAYGQNTIVLIDEYDTPMLEAWTAGTWDECSKNMRLFFNKTLKTNPYLHKALLTGITRISKESFFSDLNHLRVCSMTSSKYDYAFGFTEEEVRLAMEMQGLDNFEEVKEWYDGFTIGKRTDIYNPWSMVYFLSTQEIKPYWVNSSANTLINTLFMEGDQEIKQALEDLINHKTIITTMQEETPFKQVSSSAPAMWSLLFASGYLKIVNQLDRDTYELTVTNKEVHDMLIDFVKNWFPTKSRYGNGYFENALLSNDVDFMQEYLERIIRSTFSFFDVSGEEPERFFHGFILGIIINMRDRFIITSNRESGLGRYDVVLIPKEPAKNHAIILEFKVFRPRREADLVESAKNALDQIEEKHYEDSIIEQGISPDNIYKYGIAFKGKEIWIEGSR